MAHLVGETNQKGSRFVGASSRYRQSDVIYYSENNFLTFKIYKRKYFRFNSTSKWYEITSDVEFRPDLVSFDFYGAPDFWWKIMEANGMKDILEFRAGKNIRIPGNII